jgi:hypothetical protein
MGGLSSTGPALVQISITTLSAGSITDVVSVACDQLDPNLVSMVFQRRQDPGATNATLTLNNVTAAQAGSYSAALLQALGFDEDDVFEADSAPASLQVGP